MPMNNRILRPLARPLLLDAVPGAAAAYSLRQLSNAYTGPVVTVRRSSDAAEADFKASEIDDGTLTAFCGAGDGFVKTWFDQSGSGNDASQGTAANQPKIVSSGSLVTEGGKAALEFDGSNDYLTFSTLSLGTQHYIATVTFVNPGEVANILLGHTSPGNINYDSGSGGRLIYNANNTAVAFVGSWPVSQQVMISVERSGLSVTARTNGAEATGSMASNENLTLSRIGLRSGLDAFTWSGTIQEICIYNFLPESIERIEGDLAWYY